MTDNYWFEQRLADAEFALSEKALPTLPGAYWKPDTHLSHVWTLRKDGTWHYNITGKTVSPFEVPEGLQWLGGFHEEDD